MTRRMPTVVCSLAGALALLVCSLGGQPTAEAAKERRRKAAPGGFMGALERIKPSVVRVNISKEGKDVSSGSGWVRRLGGRRLVVTAAHVVQDAKEIHISVLDGNGGGARWLPAKLLGYSDMHTGADVALLEVKGLPQSARPMQTHEAPPGGGRLAAVGFPGGKFTVDAGHGLRSSERYVYTNGILAPGTSGGPTVNAFGEAVGISVISETNQRTSKVEGRSVPMAVADVVLQRILAGEINDKKQVEHAKMGIYQRDASTAEILAMQEEGVRVGMARPTVLQGVNKQVPAGRRLQPGDVIVGLRAKRLQPAKGGKLRQLSVDLEPTTDNISAASLMALPGRGEAQLHYRIWRPARKRNRKGRFVEVAMSELPTERELARATIRGVQRDGMHLAMSEAKALKVKTDPKAFVEAKLQVPKKGVRIDAIPPGSALDKLALQAGDVLFAVEIKMAVPGVGELPPQTIAVDSLTTFANLFVTPPPAKVLVQRIHALRDGHHLKVTTTSEKEAALINDEVTATHKWQRPREGQGS